MRQGITSGDSISSSDGVYKRSYKTQNRKTAFSLGSNECIHQLETQVQSFLELLGSVTTRKKIFDVALVATLKDNGISGIYTSNIDDFVEFAFLEVKNPLKSEEE